jgi:hypothetical protein
LAHAFVECRRKVFVLDEVEGGRLKRQLAGRQERIRAAGLRGSRRLRAETAETSGAPFT